MIDRAILLDVFRRAVRGCDPAVRVTFGMLGIDKLEALAGRRFGIAVGKAALAMARGAGAVEDGVAVVPADDGEPLPPGWRRVISAHPLIDARSQAAFDIAIRIVEDDVGAEDVLLVLISGGASSLLEAPRGDITLAELRAVTSAVMDAGVAIEALNTVRGALSIAKAGGLVLNCAGSVITLAVSDVVDDDLAVIGSGPTFGPWLAAGQSTKDIDVLDFEDPGAPADQPLVDMSAIIGPTYISAAHDVDVGEADAALRRRARALLDHLAIACPPSVDAVLAMPDEAFLVRRSDTAQVVAPMRGFAAAAHTVLAGEVAAAPQFLEAPLVGDVEACAARLVGLGAGTYVAWGEPTLVIPADHGEGGRAQQLALVLARALRGTAGIALVAGSDGIDGPAPAARPTPAGAIVDGQTWDAIVAAGIDPEAALARRDAGTALAAVDALVVTGPTGINHADLVILRR